MGNSIIYISLEIVGIMLLSTTLTAQAFERTVKQELVSSFAISPNGNFLACSGILPDQEDSIKLWDVQNGSLVRAFVKENKHAAFRLLFSPDGKYLVSGHIEAPICLWDVAKGNLVKTFGAPTPKFKLWRQLVEDTLYVNSFAQFEIIFSSQEKAKSLFDLLSKKGYNLGSFENFYSYFFNEDGKTQPQGIEGDIESIAFSPKGKYLATSNSDRIVRLWDVENGSQLATFFSGSQSISLAFSPDERYLISGENDYDLYDNNGRIYIGTDGHKVRIWDIQNGKLKSTYQTQETEITSMIISPNGKVLCTGGDNAIKLHDLESGTLIKILTNPVDKMSRLKEVYIELIETKAIVPKSFDEFQVSIKDEANTRKYLKLINDNLKGFVAAYDSFSDLLSTPIKVISFSSDGARLLSEYKESITVWDVESGKIIDSFYAGRDPVVSQNKKYLVSSAPYGGVLNIVDISSVLEGKTINSKKN